MKLIARTPCASVILLLSAVLISCYGPPQKTYLKFDAFCPYDALDYEEIKSIHADGFTGTDEEKATSIYEWQKKNMVLQSPMEQADVSYAMRWNYIMPGIYPVDEMIVDRIKDVDGTKKIYGVCWDFSALYSAIARYYGLTTRIRAYRSYMSDRPENSEWNQKQGSDIGLSPEEYEAFNVLQKKKDLEFPYEIINQEAKETWEHYRAEVKIGEEWKAFDATDPTGEWAEDSNYTIDAEWDEGKSAVLCK